MIEFVEFAGKAEYKCPKCKAVIKYARFFGSDKKLLTTDGKPANNKFGRDSNTGWPTDPNTKQMHECKKEIEVIDREGIQYGKDKTTLQPKQFPESELKITNTVDSGWGDNPPNDMDKKVIEKTVDDAYHDAEFMIWALQGVEKACKKSGIEIGPVSGMIFKEVCENIRRRNERE